MQLVQCFFFYHTINLNCCQNKMALNDFFCKQYVYQSRAYLSVIISYIKDINSMYKSIFISAQTGTKIHILRNIKKCFIRQNVLDGGKIVRLQTSD